MQEMNVSVLAATGFLDLPEHVGGTRFQERVWREPGSVADDLAEFAGRECYKSFHMPNEKTATNNGYLANILSQGHYSVLEHAHIAFYVEHVSRALLLELERHRHIGFSVESQRYVNTRKTHPEPVVPPAFLEVEDDDRRQRLVRRLSNHYTRSLYEYDDAYATLRDEGFTIKEAREAARAFLPNATPVDFIVSGNLRAWRDVLGKRWHEAADKEIRDFAGRVANHLGKFAPNATQDIPFTPYQ